MPYLLVLVIVVCAVFFHRAAEFENASGLLWSGLSVLVSALTLFLFHAGWLGILLGQIGLLIGIGVFKMIREP
jgi:Flp pilus assembly protein protease CpaA